MHSVAPPGDVITPSFMQIKIHPSIFAHRHVKDHVVAARCALGSTYTRATSDGYPHGPCGPPRCLPSQKHKRNGVGERPHYTVRYIVPYHTIPRVVACRRGEHTFTEAAGAGATSSELSFSRPAPLRALTKFTTYPHQDTAANDEHQGGRCDQCSASAFGSNSRWKGLDRESVTTELRGRGRRSFLLQVRHLSSR